MPEEEIKKDEAAVEELAKFLKESAVDKLIKSLQLVEGVPTDSESLESTFHQHGLNMRYLGLVAEQLKDKEVNHLKLLLEKDVVLRSAKHIFNEYMRDTPDTYLSSVIAHLFNLILAPFPFLDLLNENKIQYVDNTIQSVLPTFKESEKEDTKTTPKQEAEPAEAENDQGLSKKDKKKQKKKAKQVKEGEEIVKTEKKNATKP